jgi:hypothetical protein
MLDPEQARRLHRRGANLSLAPHLRRVPKVRDHEGTVRTLERQTQAGGVKQVALDDLDSSLNYRRSPRLPALPLFALP